MLQAVPDYYFAGYSRAASEAAPVVVVLRKDNNDTRRGRDGDVLHLLPSYPQHALVTQSATTNTPQRQTHRDTIAAAAAVAATADIAEDIEIQYISSSQASEWDWSDDDDDDGDNEEGGEADKKSGEDERKVEDYPGHGTLLELRGVEPTSAAESAAIAHAQHARSDAHFLIPATTTTKEGRDAMVDAEGLPPHTVLTMLGYEEAGQHAAYVLAALPPHASSSAAKTSARVMVYRCADPAVLHGMCNCVEEHQGVPTMQRLPVHVSETSASEDKAKTVEERPADVLYSPPLDPTLLPAVFGLSAAPLRYRLNHIQPRTAAAAADGAVAVQFVGVGCGVPWVCVLGDAHGPQRCEPLPLCYDQASLTRLYAPEPLTSTTNTSTTVATQAADIAMTAVSRTRPALPVTMVGAHRVRVAGPYGVPLQCDTRLSDRFTLRHGDRLRANTFQSIGSAPRGEEGRLATVIGLCGGCLVVLYDGDARATLLPSEVNTDAALKQHFTPLLLEEEKRKEEEKEGGRTEEQDDEVRREGKEDTTKDLVHVANEDAHDAEAAAATNTTSRNATPAAPFTAFLTAYGLHMSRHAVHNIEHHAMQPPWQVAQAYFMSDTIARMSAALRVYHKVQADIHSTQPELLTQEDYGRLVAEYTNVT